MNQSKTGLVIEGGGVRGIYAAGILDFFLEHGIHFDGLIGVSAGAIHGCSYLSGQKGRSIRYYLKYSRHPRFMSFRSFLKTGDFIEVEFCYHELPEKLDPYDNDAFLRCGVPFYVVCTNVETGKAEYLPVRDMFEQIDRVRASASLPYFSRIVEVDGKKYLDGGAADSIPVEAFRRMGYPRCVVILTRDASYRKKPELRALPNLLYRKYPAFAQTLKSRHTMYNETVERIAELEREGSVFVIRPDSPLDVGRLERDPAIIQRTYDTGYADAKKRFSALTEWLSSDRV